MIKRILCIVAALLLAMPAFAQVKDDAHFFSADAVKQADATIAQIQQRYQQQLVIETYPQLPGDLAEQITATNRRQVFGEWLRRRVGELGMQHGILVLITKQPGHLQPMEHQVPKDLFPPSDVNQMSATMLSAFKQKQYDAGLLSAVKFVQQTMEANSSNGARSQVTPTAIGIPRTNPPSHVTYGWGAYACPIIGVILLVMVIRGIFSSRGGYGGYGGGYGAPPPPPGYGYGGGYGGGEFGRGLFGGLLGGALGGWMYDRWSRPGGGYGGIDYPQQGGNEPNLPPPDSGDYIGPGGDFGSGDSGGGGDFGGGDSGGGDSGGGGGDFA